MSPSEIMICPKCSHDQATGDACHKCGLLRKNFANYAEHQDADLRGLGQKWQMCLENWDDESRHQELLDASSEPEYMRQLASHYRTCLQDEEQRELAQVQLATIQARAIALAAAQGESDRSDKVKMWRIVGISLAMVLIISISMLFLRLKSEAQKQPKSQPNLDRRHLPR